MDRIEWWCKSLFCYFHCSLLFHFAICSNFWLRQRLKTSYVISVPENILLFSQMKDQLHSLGCTYIAYPYAIEGYKHTITENKSGRNIIRTWSLYFPSSESQNPVLFLAIQNIPGYIRMRDLSFLGEELINHISSVLFILNPLIINMSKLQGLTKVRSVFLCAFFKDDTTVPHLQVAISFDRNIPGELKPIWELKLSKFLSELVNTAFLL